MIYTYFYDFPIGKIGIAATERAISHVYFDTTTNKPKDAEIRETKLIKRAEVQLREYFNRKRKTFSLPLIFEGTSFQTMAWKALQEIPYGEVRSYKEQAIAVGNVNACRAVGMANNRNPISIIVPCHRVVGNSGKLVGYGGGLSVKEYLLALERRA